MSENKNDNNGLQRIYNDASYFIGGIVKEYDYFQHILKLMSDGNADIELKKRYMLRAIDEEWVSMIEDTLPSLDVVMRNPTKFIEEREELVPIEQSRSVSVRSIQHLSQHTNLISSIDGDKITPSKILNVIRDETMLTYENKFINTLINRLYFFVSRRYEVAKRDGQDEKTTKLEFKENFKHEKASVNVNFSIEFSEPTEDTDEKAEKNYMYSSDLWHRVEKLHDIVTAYTTSEFVQQMGSNFIRPPVMHTNAILKNKDMHQCLLLWQFIENYDNAGYSMLVQEDLEKIDYEYIKELYSTLALQYFIFRFNIKNDFDTENTLASSIGEDVLRPRIIDEQKPLDESEFAISEETIPLPPSAARYRTATPDDKFLLGSVGISLKAAEILQERGEEDYFLPARISEPEAEKLPEVFDDPVKAADTEKPDEPVEEKPVGPVKTEAELITDELEALAFRFRGLSPSQVYSVIENVEASMRKIRGSLTDSKERHRKMAEGQQEKSEGTNRPKGSTRRKSGKK